MFLSVSSLKRSLYASSWPSPWLTQEMFIDCVLRVLLRLHHKHGMLKRFLDITAILFIVNQAVGLGLADTMHLCELSVGLPYRMKVFRTCISIAR